VQEHITKSQLILMYPSRLNCNVPISESWLLMVSKILQQFSSLSSEFGQFVRSETEPLIRRKHIRNLLCSEYAVWCCNDRISNCHTTNSHNLTPNSSDGLSMLPNISKSQTPGTSVSDSKLLITDPDLDPDPQIEN